MTRFKLNPVAVCTVLFVCISFFVQPKAFANVRLPALLTDHMVLQQKTTINLWGWADPGEQVEITPGWDQKKYTVKADAKGNWLLKVKTPAAGGPYTLSFQGKNTIDITDVYLGEVWLCSGQSNMNFTVAKDSASSWSNGVINAEETIKKANVPGIRMFTVERKVGQEPMDDVVGSWKVCDPQTVGRFSAVGYFFGRELYDQIKVPIGLISSSWGGTPAESWTRKEVLEKDPELNKILKRYDQGVTKETVSPGSNKSPYKLYNAMIHPLSSYTIKGVIWYQGESNADRAYQYRKLFPAMVGSWREEWKQGGFPFYFVQISPHKSQNPEIREAQLLSMQGIKNTGMVVTTDNGDSSNIHPRNKELVGKRLALWALNKDYGRSELVASGPIYKSMKVEGDKIRIYFELPGKSGLVANADLKEFTIAGADQVFRPAHAITDQNSILVWSDGLKSPVAVRFAWRNVPKPNLYNAAGLPASPFRTDNWKTPTQGLN
jgi:sialate O-acetylesterase